MQPYELTVEAVVDEETTELDDVTTVIEDVTQVRLAIGGGPAERSNGTGWKPYQCAYCQEPMDVGHAPCTNCGKNNVIHTPLYWASSAEILVEPESELIQLRLHLASGGFLQMEVTKTDDGRLLIHTPREGVLQGIGEKVRKLSDGAYQIG